MENITIVTFISGKETYNVSFYQLFSFLRRKGISTEGIVLCDKNIEVPDELRCFETYGMTKYRRIQLVLQEASNEYILFLDNDITFSPEAILSFLLDTIEQKAAVAWGKISCSSTETLTEKLVYIDKILSHNIIRPTLWRLKVGISLPGQIFVLKRSHFLGRTTKKDTVYDDLALGVVVKRERIPYYSSKEYLGAERPKQTFSQLIKQRCRWAQGFAETIYNNRCDTMLKFILLHGVAYHLSWLFFYILLGLTYQLGISWMLLFFLITALFLAQGSLVKIVWASLYMLIFPLVHIIWACAFIFNLTKLFK